MKQQFYNGCCYEVRVYDASMKLKYTVSHADVIKNKAAFLESMKSRTSKDFVKFNPYLGGLV
jgi:hypothetical protein